MCVKNGLRFCGESVQRFLFKPKHWGLHRPGRLCVWHPWECLVVVRGSSIEYNYWVMVIRASYTSKQLSLTLANMTDVGSTWEQEHMLYTWVCAYLCTRCSGVVLVVRHTGCRLQRSAVCEYLQAAQLNPCCKRWSFGAGENMNENLASSLSCLLLGTAYGSAHVAFDTCIGVLCLQSNKGLQVGGQPPPPEEPRHMAQRSTCPLHIDPHRMKWCYVSVAY